MDKSLLKIPKNGQIGDFLKTLSLQSNSVTRQVSFLLVKNWWKMKKIEKNQMRQFKVIFKHREFVENEQVFF